MNPKTFNITLWHANGTVPGTLSVEVTTREELGKKVEEIIKENKKVIISIIPIFGS
jgi:hypothetical protein